jgi:hypothetical protein
MARANSTSWGYKVSSRIIDIGQLVREAEGADYNLPTYIYEFNGGSRRFVTYDSETYQWANE